MKGGTFYFVFFVSDLLSHLWFPSQQLHSSACQQTIPGTNKQSLIKIKRIMVLTLLLPTSRVSLSFSRISISFFKCSKTLFLFFGSDSAIFCGKNTFHSFPEVIVPYSKKHKGTFMYHVCRFSQILDSPPPVSARAAQHRS